VIDIDNQSSGDASVSFDSYVAESHQYQQGFGVGGTADAAGATKPAVTRTTVLTVTGAPAGGLLTVNPAVDYQTSDTSKIAVKVPALG
jgi:hypothetical protein